MDPQTTSLIAASIAFVGSHFAMSHPLRGPMIRLLGQGGFMGVYSLVSAACMVWMYLAFGDASQLTPLWPGFGDASWIVASILTLLAMVLLAGSFIRNPALPAPGAEKAAHSDPHGVFRVTRHPMMWAFALWSIAHIIAAPTMRTLIVASAILILALVGAHLQDRKKSCLMGEAWQGWQSRTSYWPRFGRLPAAGFVPWLGGIGMWLLFSWIHQPLGGWDAGIWRWL